MVRSAATSARRPGGTSASPGPPPETPFSELIAAAQAPPPFADLLAAALAAFDLAGLLDGAAGTAPFPALLAAALAAFDEDQHPRVGRGRKGAGRFTRKQGGIGQPADLIPHLADLMDAEQNRDARQALYEAAAMLASDDHEAAARVLREAAALAGRKDYADLADQLDPPPQPPRGPVPGLPALKEQVLGLWRAETNPTGKAILDDTNSLMADGRPKEAAKRLRSGQYQAKTTSRKAWRDLADQIDAARLAERGPHGELAGDALWESGEGVAGGITDREFKAARRQWYCSAANDTNEVLRTGKLWGRTSGADVDLAKSGAAVMAGLIRRSPAFTRDAVMWRGLYGAAKVFGPPGSAKGKTFTDKGLVSLSARQRIARQYGDTALLVHVPAGAHALHADPKIWEAAGNDPDSYPCDMVQEFTLEPGSRFQVTEDRMVTDTSNTFVPKIRQLEVTVLPPAPGTALPSLPDVAAAGKAGGLAGLPGGERFGWRPGDLIPDSDAAASVYREEQHPRGPGGRWVRKTGAPAPLPEPPHAWHGEKDPGGRWITDAVRELDINTPGKRTVYYRKNFVDITKGSGYRVTLHPATPQQEIYHYQRAEDAAECLRQGRRVEPGSGNSEGLGPKPGPQPPGPQPGPKPGPVTSRVHSVGVAEAAAVTARMNAQFPGDYIAKLSQAAKQSVPAGQVYALGRHQLDGTQIGYLLGELRQGQDLTMPFLYREGDRYYVIEGGGADDKLIEEEKVHAYLAAGRKWLTAAVITGPAPDRVLANLTKALDKELAAKDLHGFAKAYLGQAREELAAGNPGRAAERVRAAAMSTFWTKDDKDRLNHLALRINHYEHRDEIQAQKAERAKAAKLRADMAAAARKGADAAHSIYGTPSQFNGTVNIAKGYSYAGAAGWDGSLDLRTDYTQGIAEAFGGTGLVTRPDDLQVLLHEENHLTGRGHARGQRAQSIAVESGDYITKQGKAIEEGFTELSGWWELPEWLGRCGIAGRETAFTAPGGKVPQARKDAATVLWAALGEAYNLVPPPPAADAIQDAIHDAMTNVLNFYDSSKAGAVISELGRRGLTPGRLQRRLEDAWNTLDQSPAVTHKTLGEWAAEQAGKVLPAARPGDLTKYRYLPPVSFPATLIYQNYVKAALRWTDGIARREGLTPGTPQWTARIHEVARQVNAESGPGKRHVMARQLLAALGIPEAQQEARLHPQPAGEARAWKALPDIDKATLEAFDRLDKGRADGGQTAGVYRLDAIRRAGVPELDQDRIDRLVGRGLLRKADFSEGVTDEAGRTTYLPLWQLTIKGRRLIPQPQSGDTATLASDLAEYLAGVWVQEMDGARDPGEVAAAHALMVYGHMKEARR